MRKKTIIFLCIAFLFYSRATFADVTVAWEKGGQPEDNVDGFTINVSLGSLLCDHHDQDHGPDERIGTIDASVFDEDRVYFLNIVAYLGADVSDYSYELLVKKCDGEYCAGDISVTSDDNNIYIDWEDINSISAYDIWYQRDGGAGPVEVLDHPTSSYTISNPDPGDYSIRVFPVNADSKSLLDDEALEAFNHGSGIFPEQEISFSGPIIAAPNVRVFAHAYPTSYFPGPNWRVCMGIEDIDDGAVSYNVNMYNSFYLSDLELDGSGVVAEVNLPKGDNYCRIVNVLDNPTVFLTVRGLNSGGLEGAKTTAYILFGNVIDTFNNGTSYSEAKNDGTDLSLFVANFYRQYWPTHDLLNSADLYTLIGSLAPQQYADFNQNGLIDYAEFSFFLNAPLYGNQGIDSQN